MIVILKKIERIVTEDTVSYTQYAHMSSPDIKPETVVKSDEPEMVVKNESQLITYNTPEDLLCLLHSKSINREWFASNPEVVSRLDWRGKLEILRELLQAGMVPEYRTPQGKSVIENMLYPYCDNELKELLRYYDGIHMTGNKPTFMKKYVLSMMSLETVDLLVRPSHAHWEDETGCNAMCALLTSSGRNESLIVEKMRLLVRKGVNPAPRCKHPLHHIVTNRYSYQLEYVKDGVQIMSELHSLGGLAGISSEDKTCLYEYLLDKEICCPEAIQLFWKVFDKKLLNTPLRCQDRSHSEGRTLLHHAVQVQNKDLVRRLVRVGAKVNARAEDGQTPIFCCLSVHVDTLLDNGTLLSISDVNGFTPVTTALMTRRTDNHVLRLIKEMDKDILDVQVTKIKDLPWRPYHDHIRCGWTALHIASFSKKLEICKALLEKGVDTDVVDEDGNTPLMVTCTFRNHENTPELITLFSDYGADFNVQNKKNDTVLDLAKRLKNDDLVSTVMKAMRAAKRQCTKTS